MDGFVGLVFINKSSVKNYTEGLIDGTGVSFLAEKDQNGNITFGIEADFFRTRIPVADPGILLQNASSIGGLVFAAPMIQIKSTQSI